MVREQVDVDWLKLRERNFLLSRNLVQYKNTWECGVTGGRDEHGCYPQSIFEDFVEGMFEDYKNLFGRYPTCAPTPGLPDAGLI